VTVRTLTAVIDIKPWWSRGYLSVFLKTPISWALLAVLIGAMYAEANVREQNSMACGAVLMMLDRQHFQDAVTTASCAQT